MIEKKRWEPETRAMKGRTTQRKKKKRHLKAGINVTPHAEPAHCLTFFSIFVTRAMDSVVPYVSSFHA